MRRHSKGPRVGAAPLPATAVLLPHM
jgi:hypothetical protein